MLNLDNVIYILSYDSEVLKNMLAEQHYGMEYLKKIVQVEFHVPELDQGIKVNLLFRCVENVLQVYQVKETEKKLVLKCIPLIAACMQDVRDIKRFLNSLLSVVYFLSKDEEKQLATQLNISDYIMLNFIKMENMELYETIWKNATCFVSNDREILFGPEFFFEESRNKRNNELKAFYKKVFENEKNTVYIELLKEMFPYVKHYKDDKGDILEFEHGEDNREKIVKEYRIYSGNYFPMYFTEHMNTHLDIQYAVKGFIELCNENERGKAEENLRGDCNRYSIEEQAILFEMIQLYTSDLIAQGWEVLFEVLYNYVIQADDEILFLKVDAKRRAIYILSLALGELSEQFFDAFLLSIENEYSRLVVIMAIISHDRMKKSKLKYVDRAAKVYDKLCDMISCIREQKINLYDDLYYKEQNIWGWYEVIKDNESTDIKDEFKYMLTSKSIYRFLWDMTSESLSGVYGYRLNEGNCEIFCDSEKIDKYVSLHKPETQDEQFVWEVYDACKHGESESTKTVYKREKRKVRL